MSGILSLRSGEPVNLLLGADANDDGDTTDRPALMSGQLGNLYESDADKTQFLVSRDRAIQLLGAASAASDPFAVVPRNAIVSPWIWFYDVSLAKRFRLTSRARLSVEVNAFNVFNRTNLGAPIATLSDARFGRVVATATGRRHGRFSSAPKSCSDVRGLVLVRRCSRHGGLPLDRRGATIGVARGPRLRLPSDNLTGRVRRGLRVRGRLLSRQGEGPARAVIPGSAITGRSKVIDFVPDIGSQETARYILVQCGAPVPPDIGRAHVVRVPVRRFVLAKPEYASLVRRFGVLEQLVGVSDIRPIADPRRSSTGMPGATSTRSAAARIPRSRWPSP